MQWIRDRKQRELEERWQRLSKILAALHGERATETRSDEQLRLDRRIRQVRAQREEVEVELEELTGEAAELDRPEGGPPDPAPAGAVKLFYCYAREDGELRAELGKHLRSLERRSLLSSYDRELVPGAYREREIHRLLSLADVILLLVSADFMNSSEVWDRELALAMARHERGEARVVPVLLRPVDWSDTPFAELEPLPSDRRPVVSWPSRDEAFANVAGGIRRVIDRLAPSGP